MQDTSVSDQGFFDEPPPILNAFIGFVVMVFTAVFLLPLAPLLGGIVAGFLARERYLRAGIYLSGFVLAIAIPTFFMLSRIREFVSNLIPAVGGIVAMILVPGPLFLIFNTVVAIIGILFGSHLGAYLHNRWDN